MTEKAEVPRLPGFQHSAVKGALKRILNSPPCACGKKKAKSEEQARIMSVLMSYDNGEVVFTPIRTYECDHPDRRGTTWHWTRQLRAAEGWAPAYYRPGARTVKEVVS